MSFKLVGSTPDLHNLVLARSSLNLASINNVRACLQLTLSWDGPVTPLTCNPAGRLADASKLHLHSRGIADNNPQKWVNGVFRLNF